MKIEDIKSIIFNSFHEKKNSHAFLMSTNNVDKCLLDILSLIKSINCKNGGKDDCSCNICYTIDNYSNPDVIVVKPDGKEIKKDAILNIINSFTTKSSICNYSCYIITNAEKMNDYSANKILKFLEEPEENIVGFFITDKINGIIPTIKSRCEVYNYNFCNSSILDLLEISEEEYGLYYDYALNLTQRLNDEPKYSLMNSSKDLSKYERNELDIILNLVKKFYILKYDNIQKCLYYNLDYVNPILDSIYTDNLSIIVKRIKILDNIINDFNFNVNKELFINKLFLVWE